MCRNNRSLTLTVVFVGTSKYVHSCSRACFVTLSFFPLDSYHINYPPPPQFCSAAILWLRPCMFLFAQRNVDLLGCQLIMSQVVMLWREFCVVCQSWANDMWIYYVSLLLCCSQNKTIMFKINILRDVFVLLWVWCVSSFTGSVFIAFRGKPGNIAYI